MPNKHVPELVDVRGIKHHETERAILFSIHEEAAKVWLPLSQIEVEVIPDRAFIVEVTMPRWLAEEKGLV